LLLCAFPEVAQAQSDIWQEHTVVEEPQETPAPLGTLAERPFTALLHVGVGTPFGLAGVSATYSFIPNLALEAGLGTNAAGLQVAGQLHARLTPASAGTPFVAAGYSQGKHVQDDDRYMAFFNASGSQNTRQSLRRTWSTARWINVEAGYERQLRTGMLLRFYFGGAFLLNADQSLIEARPVGPQRDGITYKETTLFKELPYLGFALGRAF
jgi:hypothetical protein